MARRIAPLLAALVLTVGVFGVRVSTPDLALGITCNDDPYYAVFYGDGSGGGGRFVFCAGDSYPTLNFSNGSQNCAGGILPDVGTWDNCFTSVFVTGTSTLVPCVYEFASYAGHWRKLSNGSWGFSAFQWSQISWSGGGNMNDAITSMTWCAP